MDSRHSEQKVIAPDLVLGDAGWFAALVDEAVTRQRLSPASAAVAAPRRALLVSPGLDLLWSSGALVGSTFERQASVVTGRNDPEAAFVELLRFQLAQVAAQWRQHAPGGSAAQMRWFTGAVLAAMAGEVAASGQLEDAAFSPHEALGERDEKRLFGIVGSRLLRRAYLLGHPPGGLPLHAGLAYLDTRTALRLATARLLSPGSLRRRAPRALTLLSRLKAQWIELLAGLPELVDLSEVEVRRTIERQVRASALATPDRRALVRSLDTPRHPARILRPGPPAVRELLIEQTVLAAVLHRHWRGGLEAQVRDLSHSLQLPASLVDEAQLKASALVVQHAGAAARLLTNDRGEGQESFENTVSAASDRLSALASSIAQEVRETGDLGMLLARMAQGEQLTRDQKARVRAQLADLARIVPALAIFAAPGGMLLLPAVLKLLPFDLRPSAFRGPAGRTSEEPPGAA